MRGRRRSATRPSAEPRGLSWSDCAVLFRSVAKDAEPARRRAAPPRHPVRRQGPEPALRQPGDPGGRRRLPLHGRPRSTARRSTSALGRRDAAPGRRRLGGGAARAGRGPRLRPRRAVGRLQHPAPLPRFPRGARRCARRPFPATPRARELVFYQLGKFSQAISDFEADLLQHRAQRRSTRRSPNWLEHQAPDYYAERTPTSATPTPDAVTHLDRAPGQGDAVAGGVRAVPAQEPFPVEAAWRARPLPRHPGQRDRRPRPLPRHSRGRDAAVLRRGDPRAEVPVRVVLARCRQPAATGSGRTSSTTAPRSSGSRPTRRAGVTRRRLEPQAKHETPQVTLSFSELKYLFECPYQFKLRFLYGFNPPLHEALGYGKGLHDALAEVHKRALDGDIVGERARPRTSSTGTCTRRSPTPRCRQTLRDAGHQGGRALPRRARLRTWSNTVHSEKQIQVHVAPGHHRRRPHRPRPPPRHRRGRDRRLQVDRPRPGRGRHARPAPRLRRRLPGAHRRTRRPDRGAQPRREGQDHPRAGRGPAARRRACRRSATRATRCGTTTFRAWPHGARSAASATSPSCVATSLHWTRRRDARLPAAKAASQMARLGSRASRSIRRGSRGSATSASTTSTSADLVAATARGTATRAGRGAVCGHRCRCLASHARASSRRSSCTASLEQHERPRLHPFFEVAVTRRPSPSNISPIFHGFQCVIQVTEDWEKLQISVPSERRGSFASWLAAHR